jgi:hypothetical protein
MEFSFDELKLPEEFEEIKNVVITKRKYGTYSCTSKYTRLSPERIKELNDKFKADRRAAQAAGLPLSSVKTPSFYEWVDTFTKSETESLMGMYLLNYVENLFNHTIYKYMGKIDGAFTFNKVKADWLHSDMKVYPLFESTITIKKEGDKWMVRNDHNMPRIYKIRHKAQYLTDEEFSSISKLSIAEINDVVCDTWIGEERDPATCFTSFFPKIEKVGNQFNAELFINLVHESNFIFGDMLASYDKRGQGYICEWRLYNDSPIGANPSSLSSGNFGESFKKRYSKSDEKGRGITLVEAEGEPKYIAETHTLTYDPARTNATLEFYIEFLPAQGKNDSYSCCYDLKTNEIRFALF